MANPIKIIKNGIKMTLDFMDNNIMKHNKN